MPSPIPEQSRKLGGMTSERDAAVARLRNRRMSVQQNSAGLAGLRQATPSVESSAQSSVSSVTGSPKTDVVTVLRPNAYRVSLSGHEYQIEAQQPGLQLFDAAGKRMVRQIQWEDIKSWSEDPDRSLTIACTDDSEFEFQSETTGPICQAMKDHTQMLLSTRNRDRADHDAAVARATRAEEAVAELQQQFGGAQSQVARLTAQLQAEVELKTRALEASKQNAEQLGEMRANAEASSSELERTVSQLQGELRTQQAELQRSASELTTAKRTHAVDEERAAAELASERRAKTALEA